MQNIIGYVVTLSVVDEYEDTHQAYVHHNESTGRNFVSTKQPTPIPRGDAYRRLAAFMDENDGFEDEITVEAVRAPVAPPAPVKAGIDGGVGELSNLLQGLCARHGIVLGLTEDEVKARIALELKSMGARSAEEVFQLAGR